jgi:hypothetical protein
LWCVLPGLAQEPDRSIETRACPAKNDPAPDVAVVGTVRHVEYLNENPARVRIVVEIEESIVGKEIGSLAADFSPDCNPGLYLGIRGFVRAKKTTAGWAGQCGSGRLDSSRAQILLARKQANGDEIPQLVGAVRQHSWDLQYMSLNDSGPVSAGLKIRIRNESGHIDTVTDDAGIFTVPKLPHGTFKVEVLNSPKGMALDAQQQRLEIDDEECVIADLRLLPSAVITGKVVASGGTPVSGMNVMLMPADMGFMANEQNYHSIHTSSDADGDFIFSNLPAGRFLVFASIGDSGAAPFKTTFFPSAVSQESSTTISIVEGGEMRGLVIDLISSEDVSEGAISVTGKDGRPAKHAVVLVRDKARSSYVQRFIAGEDGVAHVFLKQGKGYWTRAALLCEDVSEDGENDAEQTPMSDEKLIPPDAYAPSLTLQLDADKCPAKPPMKKSNSTRADLVIVD